MARQIWCWLWVLSLGSSLLLEAQSPVKLETAMQQKASRGAIFGRVTDRAGKAQAGVAVTVRQRDGGPVEKVYSQADGQFRFENLLPGVYHAEAAQPSFLPFLKGAIAVAPGAEVLLQINLFSLADSVEVGFPASLDEAAENWKMILRSGSSTRPVLRLSDEDQMAANRSLQDPRERALRGTVQFAAGNEGHGFGQDPALRTAFDVVYDLESAQMVALAGSAGWERGTPAASLRGTWNRQMGDLGSSAFSATVRQLFLPGEYWASQADLAAITDRRIQSFTVGYEEDKQLGERARVQLGSLYDNVSFGRRITRWSPFVRLSLAPSESSQFIVAYTAANPRVLPSTWDTPGQASEQWLAIPQFSSDGSGPVLEGGRHAEVQWEQQAGSMVRVQAAAFYDELSDTALSLAFVAQDGTTATLLRDPFSNRYFASAGDWAAPGMRVAVATRLSPRSELVVGYGYAQTLKAALDHEMLLIEDASSMRHHVRRQMEHSVTARFNSHIPITHTRMVASYRWLPPGAVTVSDPYDRSLGQADPYLNVFLQQPIPSPALLRGQLEAVADFGNLLAEGYVPVRTADGTTGTLFPAPRSFRGGLNIIF